MSNYKTIQRFLRQLTVILQIQLPHQQARVSQANAYRLCYKYWFFKLIFNGKAQEVIFYLSDKSTDRTDIEGNISAYYQSAKLLDESYGSGAEAAYSVRQLKRANTECMVIRRASDSTTTTIGFDGSGNISEADIISFCTGTSCTVETWKDQSGNGNDATQATPANQPTIYTGGALVKDNGRVALSSTGSTSFDFTRISNINSLFSVLRPTDFTTSANSFILGDTNNYDYHSGNNGVYLASPASAVVRNGANYLNGTSVAITGLVRSAGQYVLSMIHTANTARANAISQDRNALYGQRSWIGNRQEIIIYSDDRTNQRTSIEENVGDYFTQNTPLLDTYSGAAAAYSLRLLDSTYTGSAIRVRRSSDNTEQDIGFNVFGELDTVSLSAFAGTSDAFVKVWYDQSGNSNDATQTDTAKQPKIVSSGVVEVDANGNKIAFFDTGSIFENIATFNTSPHTAFAVTQGTGVRTQLYGFGGNNAYLNYSLEHWNGSAFQTFIGDGSTYSDYPSNASWNSDTHLVTSIYNGTTNSLYIDTALDRTDTETKTSSGALSINSRGSRAMYLAELILYTSDKSSDRAGIESNLNTFYTL